MFEPFGKIRLNIMRQLIQSCEPQKKILCDLGAGNPPITDGIQCRKRLKLDINIKTGPDIVCDLSKGIPLPDDSVDICVASEIIEHLYHSKQFISEIRRILNKNGVLILSCPNICSLKYRFSFLIGKIPAQAAKADCFYSDDRPGHIRDYNFSEVEKLLKDHGFKVEKRMSDGISILSRNIIPQLIIPIRFGDAVILKAMVLK
jgi:SAM-dependent methyltransferase